MTAVDELSALEPLAASLADRAARAGLLLVWRAQARLVRSVLVRAGRAEDTAAASSSGHAVQVFTPEGHTALASRDDFAPEPALGMFERAAALVAHARGLGLEAVPASPLEPLRARAVPHGLGTIERLDLGRVAVRLAEIESEIASHVPGVSLRLSFGAEVDAWRIARSDGTDVLFAMPRCALRCSATTGGSGMRHSVGAAVSGPLPDLLDDPASVTRFLQRSESAARLALALPGAPLPPAGPAPLVIDYALAKGLAHEAFGHASEADGFRSSVLARDGRFRTGDRVGAPHVSVVDEPIEGDHAWQPFSSNGLRRRRCTIVRHGVLEQALTDPWSSGPAGVALSAAERAESFRDAPLPRMTNIRIELEDVWPAGGTFEEYGPHEVRALLDGAGVFRRHPRVLFLSGYSGGQVNPATGDFMFNCKAIYGLDAHGAKLHRPSIFSGSMFGALESIREGFGPLLLDAIGTCGKWGQSVPSSGGSHWFLVLDPHDRVRIGGAAAG